MVRDTNDMRSRWLLSEIPDKRLQSGKSEARHSSRLADARRVLDDAGRVGDQLETGNGG